MADAIFGVSCVFTVRLNGLGRCEGEVCCHRGGGGQQNR